MKFTPELPLIDFRQPPHVDYRAIKERFFLAWPAWSYRVVVPDEEVLGLDILERAVLRLHLAATPGDRIAELLNIDRDLVTYIERQLVITGLLEPAGVTEQGRKVLRGELERLSQTGHFQTGLVFQDPFTLEVWPFFAESAPAAPVAEGSPVEYNRGHGSRGLYYFRSTIVTPAAPSPQQLYRAYRLHRHSRKNERQEEESSLHEQRQQNSLGRARLADPTPHPVYLATEIYVPEGEETWYVTSPYPAQRIPVFSPELKRLIETHLSSDYELKHRLERMMRSSVIPRSLDEQNVRFAEMARKNLEKPLSFIEKEYPELLQAVEECEILAVELRQFDMVPLTKNKDMYRRMRVLIEASIDALFNRFPPDDTASLFGKDKLANQAVIDAAVSRMGAAPFSERLQKVYSTPGVIRTWLDKRKSGSDNINVGSGLLALLVTADRRLYHPLKEKLKTSPDLMNELDSLYEEFNPGMHHSRTQFSIEEVERNIRRLYTAVFQIIGLGADTLTEDNKL